MHIQEREKRKTMGAVQWLWTVVPLQMCEFNESKSRQTERVEMPTLLGADRTLLYN